MLQKEIRQAGGLGGVGWCLSWTRMPRGWVRMLWVRPTVGRYDGQSPGSRMGSCQESILCPLPRWSLEREWQNPGLPAQFFLTVPETFSPLTLLVWSPAKPSLAGVPPHNRKTWPCGALLVKSSEREGRSQGRILFWKSEDGHASPLGTCCHPFDSNPNLLPGSQTPPDNAVKLWVLSRTEGKHAHSHSCSVYFTKVTEGCAVGVWSCRGEA